MSGLETLDILIGLVTIYLTFAVACTACVEAFSAVAGLRSTNLHKALEGLLVGKLGGGKELVDAFYDHPLVKTLSRSDQAFVPRWLGRLPLLKTLLAPLADSRRRGPSYIAPEVVGKVVEAIVLTNAGTRDLATALAHLPEGQTKELLELLFREARGGAVAFRDQVASQFDNVMARASGWFKRKTQWLSFLVALFLVVSLNVDTIAIVDTLAKNPELRAAMLEIAQQGLRESETVACIKERERPDDPTDALRLVDECTTQAAGAVAAARDVMQIVSLPLGWGDSWGNSGKDSGAGNGESTYVAVLTKVLGLALSVCAISLGAPFWFNLLDRFKAVRASGTPQ